MGVGVKYAFCHRLACGTGLKATTPESGVGFRWLLLGGTTEGCLETTVTLSVVLLSPCPSS